MAESDVRVEQATMKQRLDNHSVDIAGIMVSHAKDLGVLNEKHATLKDMVASLSTKIEVLSVRVFFLCAIASFAGAVIAQIVIGLTR